MSPGSPRRAARLALALVPLALACSQGGAEQCPGQRVAHLSLTGSRNLAADPSLPTCDATVGYGDGPVSVSGTLAQDPASPGAAFCEAPPAAILFGARTGDAAYDVSATTGGAVLGACGGTCSATLTVTLSGTLTPGTADAAGTFDGSYIERLDRAAGDCGACTLPCSARYDVTGAATP